MPTIRSVDDSMIIDKRSNKRDHTERQVSRAASVKLNKYTQLTNQNQYEHMANQKRRKQSRADAISSVDETKNKRNYQKMAEAKLKGKK